MPIIAGLRGISRRLTALPWRLWQASTSMRFEHSSQKRRSPTGAWQCGYRRRPCVGCGRRGDVMFRDRQQAGQKLAEELLKLKLAHPVVLALPRAAFRSLPKSQMTSSRRSTLSSCAR